MNTAFVFLGQFSPTSLAIIHSVKKNLNKKIYFLELSEKKSLFLKNYTNGHYSLTLDKEKIKKHLEEYSQKFDEVVALSVSYSASKILDELTKEIDNLKYLGASSPCIDILESKGKMTEIASSSGLSILNTTITDNLAGFKERPIVVRPENEVGSKFKVILLKDHSDSLETDEKVICQPYIDGPNLVIHTSKKNSDISFCYFIVDMKYRGVTVSMKWIPEGDFYTMKDRLINFLNKIGFNGVGHFEFILDNKSETPYFLEFNGRFGGTTLKALSLGYDETAHLLSEYNPKHNSRESGIDTVTSKLASIKLLIELIKKRENPLDYPQMSKLRKSAYTIKNILRKKGEFSSIPTSLFLSYLANLFYKKIHGE